MCIFMTEIHLQNFKSRKNMKIHIWEPGWGGGSLKVFWISYSGIWKSRDKTVFFGNSSLKPSRSKNPDQKIISYHGEIFLQRWRHSENFLIFHWILDFNDSPLSPVLKYVSSYTLCTRPRVVNFFNVPGFCRISNYSSKFTICRGRVSINSTIKHNSPEMKRSRGVDNLRVQDFV